MNDKIQLKRGTLANWLKADPVLADGEMALVATDASKPTVYDSQKVGDGTHKFSELEMLGYKCLQELGDSQQFPMSQKAITDWINKGYQFRGVATPSTNPGTPDGPVFYFAAEAGTYSNFNGISVAVEEVAILEWKGSWIKKTTGFATQQQVARLDEKIDDKTNEINVAKEEALQAIANLADDEDLTSVDDGTGSNVLKFKDKAYNPLTYSGMGRKILRKNIVNGVNVLTQNMINTANIIYIIQYDYTIGENITIPANCVLKFEGGSINNSGDYTLTGQDTVIIAGVTKIIDANIKIDGTWKTGWAFPEWFGAKGDGESDDSLSFRKTFENFSNVILHKKTYCMHMVPVKDLNLVGNGATLKYNGPILGQGGANFNHELNILVSRAGTPLETPGSPHVRTAPQFDTFRVTGVNFFFDGQNKRIYPFPDYKKQLSRGVFIYGFRCAIVENCTFDDSVGCSLQFSAVKRVEVRNCSFTNIGPRKDERLSGGYNAINIGQIGGYYNWDADEQSADWFYYFCEDVIIENCRIEKVCDVGITYLARNFICRNCYFNKVELPFEPVDINGGVKTLYMSQIKLIENCQFYYCGSIVIPSPVQNVQDDDLTKNYSSVSIIRNNLIEHPNEWLEDGHTEQKNFSLFEIFSFPSNTEGVGRIVDSTCIIENNIVKNAPNIKGNIFNLIDGGRCIIRGNTFEATNSMHMVYAFATKILFIQNNYFECLSETGYMFSIKNVQLYVNDNNICIGRDRIFVDRTGNGIIKITNNKFSTSHEYANIYFTACDKIDVINNEFINTGTNIGNANFIRFASEDFKSINIIGNKCEKLFNLDIRPSSVEKFIIRDNICSDFKNVGTTTERRALKLERAAYKALFTNFEFYDTDLNMGLVFNGDDFVSENGFTAALNRGTTAQRPVAMQNLGSASVIGQLKSDRDVGFEYFDTDLSKPIYAKVIDNSTGSITWVDATGTTV